MKCPKCGKDVELQKIQVGLDDNGEPILNEFAICRDCRKKWNLDKQRQKKAAETQTADSAKKVGNSPKAEHPSETEQPSKTDTTTQSTDNAKTEDTTKSKSNSSVKAAGTSKANGSVKAANASKANKSAKATDVPKTSGSAKAANTSKASSSAKATNASKTGSSKASGSAKVANASRTNNSAKTDEHSKTNRSTKTADTSKTGSSTKTTGTAKTAKSKHPDHTQKRPRHSDSENSANASSRTTEKKKSQYGNIPPENVRKKHETTVKRNYEDMLTSDSGKQHPRKKKRPTSANSSERHTASHSQPARQIQKPSIPEEPPKSTYEIPRLVIGILSILGAVFFGFKAVMARLDGISSGGKITTSTTYLILALCLLISGLITLIMKSKRSLTAFIIPILLCAVSGIFSFLKRGDDKWLLIGAVISIIFAIVFVIFAILSRDDDDDYYDDDGDDYDDPFDDDYDEY